MPNIKVYESTTSPQVGVPSLRQPRAVDNGLGTLGAGILAMNDAIERRKLEQDDTAAVTAAAELKAKLAERRQQAILDGTAADPEWIGKEREFAQTEIETVTGNLQTEPGKRRAQERNAVLLAEETGRWLTTQAQVAAKAQKNQLQSVEDITLRAIQQDPTTRESAVQSFLDDLEGPAYAQLPQDVKDEYARNFRYKAAREFLNGMEQQHGPSVALKSLDTVRDEMPAEQYTALRDHFTNRAKQQEAQDREVEQSQLFSQYRAMMESGTDPRPLLAAGVKDKVISAEQEFSLVNQYLQEVELRQKIADADVAFRSGMPMPVGTTPAIQQRVADEWATEQLQAYTQAPPGEKAAVIGAIVGKGLESDVVFTPLAHALRANPNGAQFAEAAAVYRAMSDQDGYYASRYVNKQQQARFDVYNTSLDSGMTPEQAADTARAVAPENIAKMRKLMASKEGKDIRENLRTAMEDKPWSTDEMMNGWLAAQAIEDHATTMLAANPSLSMDSAVESARQAFTSRNVAMGNLWVPRTFLNGVPADRMSDVAAQVAKRIPEVLKAENLPVVDGEYMLAPDFGSARDGRLQVYDPESNPIPGLRIGPAEFKAEYRAMQGDAYQKAVAASKSGGVSPEEYKRRTGFYPPGYKTGGAIGDPK